MIIVDIFVPILGREYDFKLDGQALICQLMEEMCDIICQKEQCAVAGDPNRLMLCQSSTNRIFQGNKTLEQYGIDNGERLILF